MLYIRLFCVSTKEWELQNCTFTDGGSLKFSNIDFLSIINYGNLFCLQEIQDLRYTGSRSFTMELQLTRGSIKICLNEWPLCHHLFCLYKDESTSNVRSHLSLSFSYIFIHLFFYIPSLLTILFFYYDVIVVTVPRGVLTQQIPGTESSSVTLLFLFHRHASR